MSALIAVAAVALLGSVLLLVPSIRGTLRQRRRRAAVRGLRRRYRRMLNEPETEAERVMARELASLAQRFPAKSELWRLKKLIWDLERARR